MNKADIAQESAKEQWKRSALFEFPEGREYLKPQYPKDGDLSVVMVAGRCTEKSHE